MKNKEFRKISADIRRAEGRKYGFRQNTYVNFKVENGYFFGLYFMANEVLLTVKPMYADDLWWDIWDAAENKKEPVSLRATGVYSLSGQIISSYDLANAEDLNSLKEDYERIFNDATRDMKDFLAKNPDADSFYPDESRMSNDPDRLLFLMALIHNDRKQEVLSLIKEARKNGHRCMFRTGFTGDSYTYIQRWCKDNPLRQISDRIVKRLSRQDRIEDNCRKANRPLERTEQKRSPWYKLMPEWIYLIILVPVFMPLMFYFFDLHRRSLYQIHWWSCVIVSVILAMMFFAIILIKNPEIKRSRSGVVMSLVFCLNIGMLGFAICVGLYDGVNRLFASKPVTVKAVMTNGKYFHRGIGRGDVSRYISSVRLLDENRTIRIDDSRLFKVPPQGDIEIVYRRGFFGTDIFETFNYSSQEIPKESKRISR